MVPLIRWASLVTALVVAMTATVAGCSSSPNQKPSATPNVTLTHPASPDTPQQVAGKAAVTAYMGMWHAYSEAGRIGNPQHPDLARFAAEEALWALTSGLEKNKAQGLISKGDLVPDPVVTKLEPDDLPVSVYIQDCLDTTRATRIQATPTGSPFIDTPGGFRRVTATVKNLSGEWKVVALLPLDVGTCQKA